MRKYLVAAIIALGVTPAVAATATDTKPALPTTCGAECQAVRAGLTPEDAAELAEIPVQVARALSLSERAMQPLEEVAENVALVATGASADGDFDRVRDGVHTCRVYWYGFLEVGSQRVGSHQCRISRKDGVITIEKRSGDQLLATIVPYEGNVRAMIGRTFLPEHKERAYDRDTPANAGNENYGNKVGLVVAHMGRLYVISINERGFTEPDRGFFEILAVQ